ncbi:MAG: hypothetical protein P4L53_04220 [Candidatus Obscuribacterales bacterium]|nr:hypothetical protein [Candidatus Obscuribacterales bacterium]
MRHADKPTKPSMLSKPALLLAIAFPLVAVSSTNTVNAQSSSLPATNMGKFVHQPGDNQYSNRTQAERHLSPSAIVSPTTATSNPAQKVCYVPVPRIAKPDPTLSYIAADEPIHQAGFPPLPDRADLPGSGNSWINGGSRAGSFGSSEPDRPVGPDPVVGRKNPAGYNLVPAGAFRSTVPSEKYHSSNPGKHNAATARSGNMSIQSGKEPPLDPRADRGVNAEPPAPIMLNQAKTQDLSLPDDEFSGTRSQQKKNPSNAGRMINQLERQMINPITQMGSRAPSMLNSAIHF